jgi:hypothetical protein
MRLVCPVVDPAPRCSWWDRLEAEYEAVDFHEPTGQEQLIRAMLEAAIDHGRASA